VEVSADEAVAVLRWARDLDGWDPDALAPVWIYPVTPVDSDGQLVERCARWRCRNPEPTRS
jgi:hypothetical protein